MKEATIINSTFAHVPIRGFTVSRAKSVLITNSYFNRVARKSIVVDKTNEVLVSYNQMTINAMQVVDAKDGSKLSLFCNRLLNQAPTPECTRTTTTTTTTTASTTTATKRTLMIQEFPDHSVIQGSTSENRSKADDSEKVGFE